jgi:hypothetical protein
MSSSEFLCNGKYYIISKSFSNILESTGESFTDIKKSEKKVIDLLIMREK